MNPCTRYLTKFTQFTLIEHRPEIQKTNNPTRNTFYTYVKNLKIIAFYKEKTNALELGFNFGLKATGHSRFSFIYEKCH
jgi:hypothetical protein